MTTSDGDLGAPGPGRAPIVVAGVVSLVTVVLWLARDLDVAVNAFVLPMFLVLVATFNAMTLFVLAAQYRAGAGPRILVLTWAFVWSASIALVTLLVLPSGVTRDGLTTPGPDVVPYLWALRHVGVPILVTTALLPWFPAFADRLAEERHRVRRIALSHAVVLLLAGLLAALVVFRSDLLPAATSPTPDGMRPATWLLNGVLAINFLLLGLGVIGAAVRRRVQGLEIWAIVALFADFGDTLLTRATEASHHLAWYGARGLGLTGAVVMLAALLREINLLQQRTRDYADQLEAQNAALTEAQGLRDHLVAVVSHDMRSPLAGLQGYLEVLEGADDLRPEEIVRMHARSRLLTRRLIMLTEDLLASATTGGLQVIPEPVNLRRQIDDCVASFPELVVIVYCPTELEVMADPLRLQQILANLVRNAQKYGAEPVRIHAVRLGGATAQISVSDAGQGVDPEFVPRLFDRYSRGNTNATHGSGLGLSVARSLAERHGGCIDYELATNTFIVQVPAIRQREKSARSFARKALTPSRKSGPV